MIVVQTSNQREFPWEPMEHGNVTPRNLQRFIERLPDQIRPRTWARVVRQSDGLVLVSWQIRPPKRRRGQGVPTAGRRTDSLEKRRV